MLRQLPAKYCPRISGSIHALFPCAREELSNNNHRANGIDVFDGTNTVEGRSIDWSQVDLTGFSQTCELDSDAPLRIFDELKEMFDFGIGLNFASCAINRFSQWKFRTKQNAVGSFQQLNRFGRERGQRVST